MKELLDFIKKTNRLEIVYRQLPTLVGGLAVTFSKKRFREQAWVDHRTERWKKRKKGGSWGRKERKGRAILVDTGKLKRSIRIVRKTQDFVTIGSDMPYARIHNEGGRINETIKIRAHNRAKTKLGITKKRELKKSTKIEYGRVKTGDIKVKAHTRKINIAIPRRQFLGESTILTKQLERQIVAKIKKAIK